MLNREQTEAAVVRELQDVILTPENVRELVELVNAELDVESQQARKEIAGVEEQLSTARQKLNRLYEALESGDLDMTMLAPRIRRWKECVDTLSSRLSALQAASQARVVSQTDEATIRRLVADLHGGRFRGRRSG